MNDQPSIASLIPHGPPAIVLDEIVEAEHANVVCRTTVRADSPFVENGQMPAIMCIEHMAQAGAAFLGLRSLAANEPILAGLLLGARDVAIDIDAFCVGDLLEVRAEHLWGEGLAATFTCTVRRNGSRAATATLSVKRLAHLIRAKEQKR